MGHVCSHLSSDDAIPNGILNKSNHIQKYTTSLDTTHKIGTSISSARSHAHTHMNASKNSTSTLGYDDTPPERSISSSSSDSDNAASAAKRTTWNVVRSNATSSLLKKKTNTSTPQSQSQQQQSHQQKRPASVDSFEVIPSQHAQYGQPTMRTHARTHGIRMMSNNNNLNLEDDPNQNDQEQDEDDEEDMEQDNAWANMMPRSSTKTPTPDDLNLRPPPITRTDSRKRIRKKQRQNINVIPSKDSPARASKQTSKRRTVPRARKQFTFQKKNAFHAIRKHPKGSDQEYIHRKYLSQVTLGRQHPNNLSLKQCVQLPSSSQVPSSEVPSSEVPSSEVPTVGRDVWLATHTYDFFNEISVIYGTVVAHCTVDSCPCMSAGPRYKYKWADGIVVKSPIVLPAQEYITLLLDWVDTQLPLLRKDQNSKKVVSDGRLEEIVSCVLKRLFRVYAHMYHSHYPIFCKMGLDKCLNACFGRFIWFVNVFELVEKKHFVCMEEVMNEIMKKSNGVVCELSSGTSIHGVQEVLVP